MARLVNAAESWETVYTAFATVNFSAFDYNTVKQSLLDYVKLYFPEDFNDYIESSEFIAILELFAYMAELLAYRVDLNAHENFLSTAQRRESVLRLANLISYTPTRNLPARGLVKLTSVTTTESVFDSLGKNLANVKITWNDSSNVDWREQFFLVMNLVLQQPFGSIAPNERVQVGDVLLELYTLNNSPLSTNGSGEVFSYSATAEGQSLPMELVPVVLTSNGPIEKRPENNVPFNLLYGNDGLGDSSSTTGFLMLTKQGSLQNTITTFDGITPNQTFDVAVNNINDTDVWVNNIDPNTLAVLTVNPLPASVLSISPGYNTTYGYWFEVNTASAQNIIFNTNANRHKFEVETDDNDQITLIFGDGEMADIPQGSFQIWYRVSANENIVISQNAVQNVTSSFNYVDEIGSTQTLTFTFSLTSSLLNASATEDIEHIRSTAPGVYFTQDRMVNAQDYNTFMLQDPSILKLIAFNRTFAGDSKYIAWHDPSESYENVKLFGDDLALYFQGATPDQGKLIVVSSPVAAEVLLLNYIQPLLASSDFFTTLAPIYNMLGGNPATLRTAFTSAELTAILAVLTNPANQTIYFYYSVLNDAWTTSTGGTPVVPANATYMLVVQKVYSGSNQTGWTIQYATTEFIAQSVATHFWNTNNGLTTINYDTLNSKQDTIVVLSANIDATGSAILGENLKYNVLSQVQSEITPGLPNLSKLNILPTDTNGDGIPDDMAQVELLNKTVQDTILATTPVNTGRYEIDLPRTYILNYSPEDLVVKLTPAVTAVGIFNGGTSTITIMGIDVTSNFPAGSTLLARRIPPAVPTANDGYFIVNVSAFGPTDTTLTVMPAPVTALTPTPGTVPFIAGTGTLISKDLTTTTYTLTNDIAQPYYYNEYVNPPNPSAIVSNQIQVGGSIPGLSSYYQVGAGVRMSVVAATAGGAGVGTFTVVDTDGSLAAYISNNVASTNYHFSIVGSGANDLSGGSTYHAGSAVWNPITQQTVITTNGNGSAPRA